LRDLYGSAESDRRGIEQWLMDNGRVGDDTARGLAAFYALLLAKSPKSSAEFAKGRAVSKSSDTKTKSSKPTNPELVFPPGVADAKADDAKTTTSPVSGDASSTQTKEWLSLHVDLQIHISPDASAEQIDQIFASMARHIVSMRNSD
jgi:hypothetical protein